MADSSTVKRQEAVVAGTEPKLTEHMAITTNIIDEILIIISATQPTMGSYEAPSHTLRNGNDVQSIYRIDP